MWIQTLPGIVQARILSFLAHQHQRFDRRELCTLARVLLSEEGKGIDFWVKKAAQHLLDLVSDSNYEWLYHLNLDSEEEEFVEDEFYSMPDWLRDAAKDSEPMFPWLPLSPNELSDKMPSINSGGDGDDLLIDVEETKQDHTDEVMLEVDEDEFDVALDIDVEKEANSLKTKLLTLDTSLKAVELSKEIRKLCFNNKRNCLSILNLIEPWSVDDETAAVLLNHLTDENEADESEWPSHILCSVILPKFLVLNEPSSRVLINATVEFCRAHQRAAEYALLFPLILRKDGINNPISDVISRIVKECLHPVHVSAFCQKLLTKDETSWRFVCLPCHRCLISEKLVWTESLFGFWRSVLERNVCLLQESVDQLVKEVCENSERYSKSLKFGNFVLCLVNKFGPTLRPHKVLLSAAIQKSNTLVTKSILSKLSAF